MRRGGINTAITEVFSGPEFELQAWWAKGLWVSKFLQTLQGDTIQLIHNGTFNSGEGPDFFNAAILHDNHLLHGDIEIHNRASDWFRHLHDHHPLYKNLLLHVVWVWDLPQPPVGLPFVIELSGQHNLQNPKLKNLARFSPEFNPLCSHRLNDIPAGIIQATLNKQWELRLISKWEILTSKLDVRLNHPDSLLYFSLMRAIGVPFNSEPMEWLATQLPWEQVQKIQASKGNLLHYYQGLSDFLEPQSVQKAGFFLWAFQNRKTNLLPIPFKKGNSRRAVQPKALLSLASKIWLRFPNPADNLLKVTPDSAIKELTKIKGLGKERALILYINGIAPLVYKFKGINALKELNRWPIENNRYTRFWIASGMPLFNLQDGQAALQLYQKECAAFKCLQCPIGQHLLNR